MTNLSVSEKIALEEVFLVLNEKKVRKMELLKKYLVFYKYMKMLTLNRKKFSIIKR